MLQKGLTRLLDAPWMVWFPGLLIALTVLAFNFVGDGIRDALDPKTMKESGALGHIGAGSAQHWPLDSGHGHERGRAYLRSSRTSRFRTLDNEERMHAVTDPFDRAGALHERAIIIDGHSDILMAVADNKMRLGTRFALPDSKGWQAPLGWTSYRRDEALQLLPAHRLFPDHGAVRHPPLPRGRPDRAGHGHLHRSRRPRPGAAPHPGDDLLAAPGVREIADFALVQSAADFAASRPRESPAAS